MVSPKIVGERLRELRGDYPLEYVGWKVGCTRQAICAYEKGIRMPKDETKVKLADLFGKTVQELFFDE